MHVYNNPMITIGEKLSLSYLAEDKECIVVSKTKLTDSDTLW